MSNCRRFRTVGRQISAQSGVSLMELLVVMVIMFVVLGAIYTIWFGLQRTYSFTDDDITAQSQSQTALSEMVESIRTARLPVTGSTPQYLFMVIVRADRNELIAWTDIDRDSQHRLELVRYRVDTVSRNLYRDNYGRADVAQFHNYSQLIAADPISTLLVGHWLSDRYALPSGNSEYAELFSYFDGSETQLSTTSGPVADPTQIRQVKIDLLVDVRTDFAPIAHELTAVVQPRNLRQY